MIKKKNLSEEDKQTWENYTKSPLDIFDKEEINSDNSKRQSRFKFDLHGFTLNDANHKVRELINSCQKKGFKEILLITGKGLHSNVDQNTYVSKKLSKLKFAVPEYIKSQKDLSGKIFDIKEADIKDGGEGALIIKLKKL